MLLNFKLNICVKCTYKKWNLSLRIKDVWDNCSVKQKYTFVV